MSVIILPMPESYRKIPENFRPQHPPIFIECGDSPSQDDIELARELFRILDDESKIWYGRRGIFKDNIPPKKGQAKNDMAKGKQSLKRR
jgi:hypothetical protein